MATRKKTANRSGSNDRQTCRDCGGSGWDDGRDYRDWAPPGPHSAEKCSNCNGRGWTDGWEPLSKKSARRNRSGGGGQMPTGHHSWIITNGKLRNTKNQAALRAKINKQIVSGVSVGEVNNFPTSEAVFDVFFENGDQASMTWASRDVLAEKLLTWRGLYGVPLEWNGAYRGIISNNNPFLINQVHPSRR